MKRVVRVKPQILRGLLRAELGGLHVQSLSHRNGFDVRLVARLGRQVRQALRQLELELIAPDAQKTREPLARRTLRLVGTCEAQGSVRIERLLAGARQLAEVAHLLHAASQFGACFGRLLHLPHVAHRLLRRDRLEVGLARVRGQRQDIHRDLALDLLEAARFQLRDHGQGQQPRKVEVQPAFQFDLVAPPKAPEREARVRQAPGLHDFGLGDAEILESSLQAAVVEQGHLNGIVDAQWFREQLAYAAIDGVDVGIAARPAHVLAELVLGRGLDRREPGIGGEAGASGQHGRNQDNDEQSRTSHARAVGRDAPGIGK
jgi:hypothetical protein